ncbi:MAG: HetP family heterocyst commitment protein [Cyanobacteria bacterium P01_D01_bin.56]
MNKEQFDEVIEAILDGKYSWACVLFLYFAGHNPLQYMPYRTYHRLMKANRPQNSHHQASQKVLDLSYVEIIDSAQSQVTGGWRAWLQRARRYRIL